MNIGCRFVLCVCYWPWLRKILPPAIRLAEKSIPNVPYAGTSMNRPFYFPYLLLHRFIFCWIGKNLPSKFLNWIAERVFLPQTAPASVPPLIDTLCLVNSTHSILKRPLSFTFIPHWPPPVWKANGNLRSRLAAFFLYYEYSMPNFCLHTWSLLPLCYSLQSPTYSIQALFYLRGHEEFQKKSF